MIRLENRIAKQIDSDLIGALTDPIVVFDPGWADVLPDWLKGEIKIQRLAQLMKGEEGIATDAEALAYVSNASLYHPIASELVDIYQYLLAQVMGEQVPEELRKDNLDDYKMGLLRDLKEWIWRQSKGEGGARESREAKGQGRSGSQCAQATRLGYLTMGAGNHRSPFFVPRTTICNIVHFRSIVSL